MNSPGASLVTIPSSYSHTYAVFYLSELLIVWLLFESGVYSKYIETHLHLPGYMPEPETLENMPMGDELKWLLKEGGGHIFKSCRYFSPFLSCACLCNNTKWCLPSFVSPSSCIVLLLCCTTACTGAQIGGHTVERKVYFATTSFKKGGGVTFESGPIFSRLRYMCVCVCLHVDTYRYVLNQTVIFLGSVVKETSGP